MRKSWTMASIIALTTTANVAQAGWFSDEQPPANAKPLSEIIKPVEDRGFKTITEVGFDDGVWSIEAHQADGKEVTFKVDAVTGESRQ